jgi:hypothetical protein
MDKKEGGKSQLDVGGKNSHRLSPIYFTSIADIKTFRFRLKRSFPPQRNHENAQSFLPLQHILQYCRPGLKKGDGYRLRLHAGQPINADCAAGGITPELYELLNGKDASQILDRSAVLSMAALEQLVWLRIPGDPADMSNADDIAVEVCFKNSGATILIQRIAFVSYPPPEGSGLASWLYRGFRGY